MPRQSTNLNELETKNPLVQTEFKFNFETLVTRDEAVRSLMKLLPASHQPYTDKYFLRTNDILKAEGLNPIVRAQVFIRKGDVEAHGLNEAIAVIRKYSQLEEHGGTIKALPEGSHFSSKETLLEIEGPAQDIVELETMYLGVLTRETSLAAGITRPQPDEVRANAEAVMEAVQNRPVLYFGARHWGYEQDAEIAKAAFDGGFTGTSTDIGAEQIGAKGQGTIPHALENIMASVYGRDFAVVEATKAFDKHIDPAVPRIALIDYNNKEITDAIATAQALGGRLAAVRVDTCGENIAEGAIPSNEVLSYLVDCIRTNTAIDQAKIDSLLESSFGNKVIERKSEVENWLSTAEALAQSDIPIQAEHLRYWTANGVTISGVYQLRKALDQAGFQDVQIVLTSGFANREKCAAFMAAEEILGMKLFDQLGAGQLFQSLTATMDIVNVADSYAELGNHPCSKVGRYHRQNPRLELAAKE